MMLPFMIIILTMQTKLGAKLKSCLKGSWTLGMVAANAGKRLKAKYVKVSQPLAGQHQVNRADHMDNGQVFCLTILVSPQVLIG